MGQPADREARHEPLHLHGHLLDATGISGPRDLWVSEGIVVDRPVADATTICQDAWILPGFVDAHCHIGLDHAGPVSAAVAEQQALIERSAGTLLVRDAGSPSDTAWINARADLPTIVRAGRHIARPKRYLRNFAVEVEPADLVASVEAQARAGDGWVKLVGDWIDRQRGDLAPLWPQQVAAAAIERAHELGARVCAHCFTEQSATELVAAGVDSIEHGTGLTEAVLATMAEQQIALVPTMVNLENFEEFARLGEPKFPTYAAHMRTLSARRFEVVRTAHEMGVPIYAGTDAGGTVAHGLIGGEIERLAGLIGTSDAVAAACWRARTWLGHPAEVIGAPANLVVLRDDPRADPRAAQHPHAVVVGGQPFVAAN